MADVWRVGRPVERGQRQAFLSQGHGRLLEDCTEGRTLNALHLQRLALEVAWRKDAGELWQERKQGCLC